MTIPGFARRANERPLDWMHRLETVKRSALTSEEVAGLNAARSEAVNQMRANRTYWSERQRWSTWRDS